MLSLSSHPICLFFIFFSAISQAFTILPAIQHPSHNQLHFSGFSLKLSSSSAVSTSSIAASVKDQAESLIIENNGKIPVDQLEPLLAKIEAENNVKEPNRSPNYKGRWHVWYSNAPPPSNGQLGPFQGSAEQEIALEGDGYNNVLRLPPNSGDDEWLTVVLDGVWEDWDGTEIPDGDSTATIQNKPSTQDQDWGANFWKVTFLRLNFRLFGNLILSKDFPAEVARVWRTTYLDDDTRIVRAGRTGRTEDESVFYMKRSIRPTN